MQPLCNSMEAPQRAASGVTLKQAVESLLFAKASANYRPRYVKSLRQYLALFAKDREESPVSALDVFTLETWFAKRNESLASQASNIGRLSALFSFCERRGWIDKNPCRMLERVRIDQKPPKILSVDQAREVMQFAMYQRPLSLAYFTLALFAGIRPEELEKIGWESVDLTAGKVRVDAAASKVRRRRIVHLMPNACEWLAFAKDLGSALPYPRSSRTRALRRAAKKLGFDGWPQDVLRHSAASYLMTQLRDVGRVADDLGNSPSILLRHYRELVSAENALAFWGLSP